MAADDEVIAVSELVNLIGSQQIEIAMLKGRVARLQAELAATYERRLPPEPPSEQEEIGDAAA